jgi:hypothetical protein
VYLLLEKILHGVVKFQMPKVHSGKYISMQLQGTPDLLDMYTRRDTMELFRGTISVCVVVHRRRDKPNNPLILNYIFFSYHFHATIQLCLLEYYPPESN